MPQPAAHCPFLNRSDARCNERFNLKGLGHAYEFCFGRYQACPNYQQLLNERQQLRAAPIQLTIHARGAGRRAVA
jgi:hypothetical protein